MPPPKTSYLDEAIVRVAVLRARQLIGQGVAAEEAPACLPGLLVVLAPACAGANGPARAGVTRPDASGRGARIWTAAAALDVSPARLASLEIGSRVDLRERGMEWL
jgi:hypothetical protein